jgi:hypothetical protein
MTRSWRGRFGLRVGLWLLLDEGGRVMYEGGVKEYVFDEEGSGVVAWCTVDDWDWVEIRYSVKILFVSHIGI